MILHPDEIIKKAQKCLKEGRNPTSALSAIGMAYFEKGLLDKAIFYYQKALERDEAFAPAYAGLGIVYGKKGLVTESVYNLKEAIRLSPDCALLYNWLGDAYFDLGRTEDAIREYGKATELDSLDSNAHNDLADAYRRKGDFAQALDYYQKTLEIDPSDTNAILEKAQVLLHLDRRDEARALLLDMVARFTESEDTKTAKVVLGALFTQEGDYISARDYLAQAARDYPFNPTIQFHLGLCDLILDEPEAAKTHLQRTVDLDPANVRVVKLIQQLRKRSV